ncbi:hypothetical protein [Vibrio mexicanus]|uniref:hypothetical protein n=1 Tax=Vibrio mexicanus TaxID=1004326 RepID=UPI00063C9586|nr:hypothetical protein [Vibrio mexicanus]
MKVKKNALRSLSIMMLIGMSCLSSGVAVANTHSSTAYATQTEQYAMVSAVGKLLSLTKWKVEVDFGQALKLGIKNQDLLRDDDGKVISFNSPIDAVNFLNSKGWVLVSASTGGDQFMAVMKRKIEEQE